MASKLFLLITLPILISIPFFTNPTCAAKFGRTSRVRPEAICKYTRNPYYCKSMLANVDQTADVYTYGRFSFHKAFSRSYTFLNLVDGYLKSRSTLSTKTIRALEDCYLLADLNLHYFSSSFQTVNTTSEILPTMQADDVQTRLSAILTNQQTCLDGLQAAVSASNIKNGLSVPLFDDTKLSSVLLALFKQGWVGRKNKETPWQPTDMQRLFGKDGRLPLIMSDENRAIFESVCKRKLKNGDGGVLVSEIVTVSQDGRGNFSTINDAINAAPNNTDISNGYFLIYIKGGVYQEYISIDKNKVNLMMIGDGINKTIITGNRSAGDGWTTFNSATFAVVATNFTAVDITFRNTAGPSKFQAVALRSGADLSTFYSCSFEGYQDTLYTHSLRQFYRDCDIYGTIDFILGNAAVVLQNCNMYARLPMVGQYNC